MFLRIFNCKFCSFFILSVIFCFLLFSEFSLVYNFWICVWIDFSLDCILCKFCNWFCLLCLIVNNCCIFIFDWYVIIVFCVFVLFCFSFFMSVLVFKFEEVFDFLNEFICLCLIVEKVLGVFKVMFWELKLVLVVFKLIKFLFWNIEGFVGDCELLIVVWVVLVGFFWIEGGIDNFWRYDVEFKLMRLWFWSLFELFWMGLNVEDILVSGILFDFMIKFLEMCLDVFRLVWLCFLIVCLIGGLRNWFVL